MGYYFLVQISKWFRGKKYTVGIQELRELLGSLDSDVGLPQQPLWLWEASGFSLKKIYPALGSW